MSVTGTPVTTPPIVLPCFFDSLAEADALAAALPGLAWYKAADATKRLQLLVAATDRVAKSRAWQGSKVDPGQALPFPRYKRRPYPFLIDGGEGVWDLDPTTQLPSVPLDVKKATLYEADALCDPERARLLQAAHNGLAAQSTGGMSETYRDDAKGLPVVCEAAEMLLRQYARRSAVLT